MDTLENKMGPNDVYRYNQDHTNTDYFRRITALDQLEIGQYYMLRNRIMGARGGNDY
jgi:hypothetical protein